MGTTMSLRALCLATTVSLLGGSFLGACSVTDFTPAEKEMLDTMGGSAYQPATRELRDGIETQDLLAQASFWSREYNLNPTDLESAIKLAATVRKMGNPGRAAEIAQITRALHPNDPYLAAEYAAALVAGERGKEALPVIESTVRQAPNYARLWSLRGAALDQAERYAEARQSYGKALSITPYDPNVLANMGLSFALEGNPREGLDWLERASALPGASASVSQNLELVRELAGKAAPAPTSPRTASLAGPRPVQQPRPQPQPQQAPVQRTPRPMPTRQGPTAGLAGPGAPIATARKPLQSTDEDALHRLAANASPARRAVMERRPAMPMQQAPMQRMPGQPMPQAMRPQPMPQQPMQQAPMQRAPMQAAPMQAAPNPYAAPQASRPAPQMAPNPYAPPQPQPQAASAPARSPFAPRPQSSQPTPQPAPQTVQQPQGYPPAPVLRGPSRPR